MRHPLEYLSLMAAMVLTLVTGGFIFTSGEEEKPDSRYQGEIFVTGLKDTVVVYRDARGMPHIRAKNEQDLYFTTGYITAQERLWQMDLIRRANTGRLSEIFGEGFVTTDLFMRSLDFTSTSKKMLDNLSPEILECLKAYTKGVNNFIESGCRKLPLEFRLLSYGPEPWTLEDIANIIGSMGWNLASRNMTSEIFNYRVIQKLGPEKAKVLIPDFSGYDNCVFPDFRLDDTLLSIAEAYIASTGKIESLGLMPLTGSNNWAVAGERSETGKPVLSNDMHLTLSAPGIWMQMHQTIPGKLDVTGVMIPGEPFIVAGHNDKIAWGMTNLMVDDIDLYAEKINPENPRQYYYNGGWNEMAEKREVIKIRGGKSDTFDIRFTHRGPLIQGYSDIDEDAISMKWSGDDPGDEISSVYLLNRGTCWEDFRSALSLFGSINQNFAYADTEGNIGLSAGGRIPLRKLNGNLIRNGQTDEYDWKGFIPFEQLPYVYNPAEGCVSSANNKTVDNSYPYYIGSDFAPPYRITRIRNMLKEKEIFGPDDFKRMILDQHSDLALLLTPHILKLNGRKELLSDTENAALALFAGWDYDMDPDLAVPSLFEFFRKSLIKELLADDLGELFNNLYYIASECYLYGLLTNGAGHLVDNINTPQEEVLEDIILLGFKESVKAISEQYGKNMEGWKWGDIHRITMKHPLGSARILDWLYNFNSECYGVGGSDHTISSFFSFSAGFSVDYGSSERHIFNTADWDESFTIIPTGASGIPSSEFYLSQSEDFFEGRFYKDAFSEGAVKAAGNYKLLLIPAR